MSERPPTFDVERFAAWLRRHMDAWDMTVPDLAQRSGLNVSTIANLRRGRPEKGRATKSPAINAIAAIAWGLQMPLDFVAAQAGLTWNGPIDRWDLLVTEHEREVLARRLGGDAADLEELLRAAVKNDDAKEIA
jgi:transcriptional regulator with XRE-family HTH domain